MDAVCKSVLVMYYMCTVQFARAGERGRRTTALEPGTGFSHMHLEPLCTSLPPHHTSTGYSTVHGNWQAARRVAGQLVHCVDAGPTFWPKTLRRCPACLGWGRRRHLFVRVFTCSVPSVSMYADSWHLGALAHEAHAHESASITTCVAAIHRRTRRPCVCE